jgi:hypothetical protein
VCSSLRAGKPSVPSLADMREATPKCPRLVAGWREDRVQLGERCAFALTPLGRSGAWSCPVHGVIEAVEIVPLRRVSAERRAP